MTNVNPYFLLMPYNCALFLGPQLYSQPRPSYCLGLNTCLSLQLWDSFIVLVRLLLSPWPCCSQLFLFLSLVLAHSLFEFSLSWLDVCLGVSMTHSTLDHSFNHQLQFSSNKCYSTVTVNYLMWYIILVLDRKTLIIVYV